MDDTYNTFNIRTGNRIMEIRTKLQYTREYLAEVADISPKFLYEIEMGKKGCSSYILYRISLALKVTPSYLMQENLEGEKYELTALYTLLTIEQKQTINKIIQLFYLLFYNL